MFPNAISPGGWILTLSPQNYFFGGNSFFCLFLSCPDTTPLSGLVTTSERTLTSNGSERWNRRGDSAEEREIGAVLIFWGVCSLLQSCAPARHCCRITSHWRTCEHFPDANVVEQKHPKHVDRHHHLHQVVMTEHSSQEATFVVGETASNCPKPSHPWQQIPLIHLLFFVTKMLRFYFPCIPSPYGYGLKRPIKKRRDCPI